MYNKSPEESKKISWLSIFSSLCSLSLENVLTIDELEKRAYELNDKLSKTYKIPDTPATPFPSEGDSNCPKCGAVMRQIPAGVSKKTGKPYSAFWSCPNRCK